MTSDELLRECREKRNEYYRAMREFQERNSNQAQQIRKFKAALKHCVSKIARSIDLIEADVIEGDLGALNELNELVVYIANVLPSLSQKEEAI